MADLILNRKAVADLAEIADFYPDPEVSERMIDRILEELQYLADNTLVSGRVISGMRSQYRRTNIVRGSYQVYFRRQKSRTVLRVCRVYSSRRRPLTPEEIKG